MTRHGTTSAPFQRLADSIGGNIVLPGDRDYDDARSVWNGMIDKSPAVIVRAATEKDVLPAIAWAKDHALEVAIRGGGHSIAGHGTSHGGIVLDLSACNQASVDPKTRTVTTGPGATLADLDAACAPHGLVVPAGVVSATGIAGLCLGGGFGWLTRAYGLTVDNLLAADVVTASGQQVRADATQHQELLWALKGGGGNFGVVTSFTFAAHRLPELVYSGNLIYFEVNWRHALTSFSRWAENLPDQLTPILSVLTPPPAWELGTEPVLVIGFACAGGRTGTEAAKTLIRDLISVAPPDVSDIGSVPWPQWQSAVDDVFPKGVRAYWKNTGLNGLDEATIEAIVEFGGKQRWVGTAFDIHLMGGAFARVADEATAFSGRKAAYWINIYGFWTDPELDEHHTAFVRSLAAAMEPHSSGHEYLNFTVPEPDSGPGTRASVPAYDTETLKRLGSVKRIYDPGNMFHLNHNIIT